jgi:fructose-specific phosphotransferase system IIC component
MEQVNAKRVAIFVVSACLIGMAVGSAITLAVLNVQRPFPTSGLVVAVNVGVYFDDCTLNLALKQRTLTAPAHHSLNALAKENERPPRCK